MPHDWNTNRALASARAEGKAATSRADKRAARGALAAVRLANEERQRTVVFVRDPNRKTKEGSWK